MLLSFFFIFVVGQSLEYEFLPIDSMKRLLAAFGFVILLLAGCIEDIDVLTGEDRLVVVNGMLTQEGEQELLLCWSGSGDDRDSAVYEPIGDADVVLLQEGKEVGHYIHQGGGRWTLRYQPSQGENYALRVTGPAIEEPVTAETTMPEAQISAFSFPISIISSQGYIQPSLGLEVQSDDEESILWIYVEQEAKSSNGTQTSLAKYIGTDHEGADLVSVSNCSMRQYLNDGYRLHRVGHILDRYPYETLDIPGDYPLMQRYLRITHPRDYHKYLQYGGYRALTPDGATHLVKDLPYPDYISMHPLFQITFSENVWTDLPIDQRVVVLKVSEELDQYLLSGWQKAKKQQDEGFLFIYDRENPYSNVKNGTGIFGAAVRFVQSVDQTRYYVPQLIPDAPWEL